MTFLGISMIISAAIIAATFIYLFKAGIKLYKEILNDLFKNNDSRDEDPGEPTNESVKFGGF